MENFQQRRVHKQSFRLAYEFGEDLAPQSFQKASELAHPPVEGGRVESSHPRKQVREEPLDIPQERAFALHAPKLLEDSEGDDFGVRKALYGLVAVSTRVEMGVSLVHETEEDSQSLFRVGEAWSMVELGHLLLLGKGRLSDGPFLSHAESTQRTSSAWKGSFPKFA